MMSLLWTDEDLKHAVDAYQQMLKFQINKTPFVKAEINRELQSKINRSRGSIEMRFQNISSVLHAKGQAWVKGYVPLGNVGATNEEKIWQLIMKSEA